MPWIWKRRSAFIGSVGNITARPDFTIKVSTDIDGLKGFLTKTKIKNFIRGSLSKDLIKSGHLLLPPIKKDKRVKAVSVSSFK